MDVTLEREQEHRTSRRSGERDFPRLLFVVDRLARDRSDYPADRALTSGRSSDRPTSLHLNYAATTYSGRLMQSIEYVIVYETQQHAIRGFEPDDVAQELRIHLWNKIHLYDPVKANFKTWSMRVIHNKIIDMASLRGDLLDPHNRLHVTSIHDEEGDPQSDATLEPYNEAC